MAVVTIYPMDIDESHEGPFWLHWLFSELGSYASEVDVARGPVLGDQTERTYFTGTDAPRVTNLDYAVDEDNNPGVGLGEYPYFSFLMGVPAPTEAPTLEVVVTAEGEGSVTLTNAGAESGDSTGWTLVQGQLLTHDDNDVVGITPPEGTYYFYGGTAAVSEAYQAVDLDSVGIVIGQSITLAWKQASGANLSKAKMGMAYYNASNVKVGEDYAALEAGTSTFAARSVSGTIPTDTASVRLVMYFEKVGGGENDAYIDAITLTLAPYTYTSTADNLEGWEINTQVGATGNGTGRKELYVTALDATHGNVFHFQSDEAIPWMRKNFQLQGSRFDISYELYLGYRAYHYVTLGGSQAGAGEGFMIQAPGSTGICERRAFSSVDDRGIALNQIDSGDYKEKWLRVHAVGTPTSTGHDVTFTVTVISTEEELVNESTSIANTGDWLNFKMWSHEGDQNAIQRIDNISVSVVKAADSDEETLATNYVYTFVNVFGEEGPPSPTSVTIQKLVGASVTITMPTEAPDDYGIEKKYIYRAVTGETSTDYFFVAEVDLDTPTYSDVKLDSELGAILESYDYDLPPTNGQGILATANGITYMFADNQLCPSVIVRPHAYPIPYRLATDFPIVAIAALDTDVIVGTQANPYIALGSDPSALTMSKIEKPQGCVSKRSMVALDGVGVIYASPDGLTMVNRSGAEVVTKSMFTRDQWQALVPSSIHAVAHDGLYFFWYDTGSVQLGYILDPAVGGFGLVQMDFYCTAAHSHPLTDQLFLVINGRKCIWNTGDLVPYIWKSKQFELERPTRFGACQIRAADYDDLTIKLYSDLSANPFFTRVVTTGREFVLPPIDNDRVIEAEITGTSRVQRIEIAESMDELS